MREAENACLAACLHYGLVVARQVTAELAPVDFELADNRAIYSAVSAIVERSHEPDLTTLISELRSTDRLERAGGVAHCAELDVDLPDVNRLGQFPRESTNDVHDNRRITRPNWSSRSATCTPLVSRRQRWLSR